MDNNPMIDLLMTMGGNLVALKQIQEGMLTMMDRNFARLGEVLATMEANRAKHEEQHTEMLSRMDARLARQDEILARIDEHTTMIAQILARFDQGRNGR